MRNYDFEKVVGTVLIDTVKGSIIKVYPIDPQGQYYFERLYLSGKIRVRGHYASAKRKKKGTLLERVPTSAEPVESKYIYYEAKPDGWWTYYLEDGAIEKIVRH